MWINFHSSQMLEDLRGSLQAAEEKRQTSIAEISAKHQKVHFWHSPKIWVFIVKYKTFSFLFPSSFVDFSKNHALSMLCLCFLQNLESLEAQLADALSDRTKATETISSLQVGIVIIWHLRSWFYVLKSEIINKCGLLVGFFYFMILLIYKFSTHAIFSAWSF